MTDLRQAAQAVVDRWDTPAWEWRDQGPTADLMADLRKALAQPEQPEQKPVAWAVFEGWNAHDLYLPQEYDEALKMAGYKGDHAEVKPLYTTPPAAQRQWVTFPTMLRKMWSGGEVQAWLDENVNREKNT
jgi:hypothetical protein